MKVKWLGHACFLVTSSSGVRIITDPYTPDSSIQHGEIRELADVVTISHEHFDHNNAESVRGRPVVLRQSGEVKGISFRAVRVYHDSARGKQRGSNTIFCFNVDNLNVCHMGDLGHILDEKQLEEIGRVDVLLIPVGGTFTVDADTASRVVAQIKPSITIPMHFKNEKVRLPVATVEAFLKNKPEVVRLDSSEIEITTANLPRQETIYVLKPAL